MLIMRERPGGELRVRTCRFELPGWIRMTEGDKEVMRQYDRRDIRLVNGRATYVPPELWKLKQRRRDQVKANTEALLGMGFPFDGKRAALDEEAHRKINSLKADIAGLTTAEIEGSGLLPLFWTALGGLDVILLDANNLQDFLNAARTYYMAFEMSGTQLNNAINNCQSEAELDAIVDSRLWPVIPES